MLSAMRLLCQMYALLSIRESCGTKQKLAELSVDALVQINIPSYANMCNVSGYIQCGVSSFVLTHVVQARRIWRNHNSRCILKIPFS